jgi:hypothetical protein
MDGRQNFVTRIQFINSVTMVVTTINTTIKLPWKRLKCDCSGKAQKQFNSKLQTRFLVREDALKAEQRNCPTREEQNKLWSRVPKGGPIPRLTGRLTVGRKKNSNSNYTVGSWSFDLIPVTCTSIVL